MASMKIVLGGIGAVLAFDLVASLAARGLRFPYAWASLGSYVLYLLIGYVAARAATGSPISNAAVAAALAGLADASAGWAIAWWLGPGRSPTGLAMTPAKWFAVAVIVVAVAAGIGVVGGLAGRRRIESA